MNAQEWKMLLSAYADGEASPEEAAEAEKLLFERSECRAYFDEIKKLSSSIKLIPNENLSSDAELKVLSAVTKERDMKPAYWKRGAAVMATILVVVLTFQQYEHRGLQGRLKSSADDIGYQYAVVDYKKVAPMEQARAKGGSVTTFASGITAPVAQDKEQYEPYYSMSRDENSVVSAKTAFYDSSAVVPALSATSVGQIRGAGWSSYETRKDTAWKRQGITAYNLPYVQETTEEYKQINENTFQFAANEPLSTLSADVDTASYSNVRRFLTQRQMPPEDAVRVEEMINYFSYDYPQPWLGHPFSITTDLAECPWNPSHQLMRIGLKGKVPAGFTLPPSNLVFLIDVSGSMATPEKLPLLKEGFKMMVQQLRPQDYVSIVVYASQAGQVLGPTSGADKERIINAIDSLNANGSTAGGEGIQMAYAVARQSFIKGGNNRVILATDGDFNVGVSSPYDLEQLISERRRDGIFLTVLGFGEGNLKDNRMQTLADKGNGNYSYIDSFQEAHKVLVSELGSTLFTIAKDVKIQVEFNPALVKEYRLIGYEKRTLAKEDFNNDRKDAGEIGAGHTVTALYEIVPNYYTGGANRTVPGVDALRYQKVSYEVSLPWKEQEIATVKLRYKDPDGDTSKLISKTVNRGDLTRDIKGDFAWATAVAEFGMLLRASENRGSASYEQVLSLARGNIGNDPSGLRAEFILLVETARSIAPKLLPVGYYGVHRDSGEGQYPNFRENPLRNNINFK